MDPSLAQQRLSFISNSLGKGKTEQNKVHDFRLGIVCSIFGSIFYVSFSSSLPAIMLFGIAILSFVSIGIQSIFSYQRGNTSGNRGLGSRIGSLLGVDNLDEPFPQSSSSEVSKSTSKNTKKATTLKSRGASLRSGKKGKERESENHVISPSYLGFSPPSSQRNNPSNLTSYSSPSKNDIDYMITSHPISSSIGGGSSYARSSLSSTLSSWFTSSASLLRGRSQRKDGRSTLLSPSTPISYQVSPLSTKISSSSSSSQGDGVLEQLGRGDDSSAHRLLVKLGVERDFSEQVSNMRKLVMDHIRTSISQLQWVLDELEKREVPVNILIPSSLQDWDQRDEVIGYLMDPENAEYFTLEHPTSHYSLHLGSEFSHLQHLLFPLTSSSSSSRTESSSSLELILEELCHISHHGPSFSNQSSSSSSEDAVHEQDLLMNAFAHWMDGLLVSPSTPPRPFLSSHFFMSPSVIPRSNLTSPSTLAIVRSIPQPSSTDNNFHFSYQHQVLDFSSSPHFKVLVKGKVWEAQQGRLNPFAAMVLLLTAVDRYNGGILGHANIEEEVIKPVILGAY